MSGRVVAADDCTSSGQAAALTVRLPGPLNNLRAQPSGTVRHQASVGTMRVGPYQGTITGTKGWTVWWKAGGMTYSMWTAPAEGQSLTLTTFKQQIAGLWT